MTRLHRFVISDSQQCYLCICARETDSHLFLHCSYSRWVLHHLMAALEISINGDTWFTFLLYLAELADRPKSVIALCVA